MKKAIDNYDCDKSGTILQQKFVENVEGVDLEILKKVCRQEMMGLFDLPYQHGAIANMHEYEWQTFSGHHRSSRFIIWQADGKL